MSVGHVVERSGVSRRTFYETFADREDCFYVAFEDALGFARQRVLPACEGQSKWRERIRAGLVALLSFLDEEPAIGRLLIVESLSGGTKAVKRREQVLISVAAAIDEGREQSASTDDLPPLTAEGLVGGALSVIHTRLAGADPARDGAAQGKPLLGLANQLMSMLVLPYLGAAAARRELERPLEVRVSDRREARLIEDPFKSAGMRLTYRTVRVLLAVAEHPGASNRLLGEAAGISDQGQISKLLGRLRRLDLVSNAGLAPGQGAPNEWNLTAAGEQLTKSIRTHSQTEGD